MFVVVDIAAIFDVVYVDVDVVDFVAFVVVVFVAPFNVMKGDTLHFLPIFFFSHLSTLCFCQLQIQLSTLQTRHNQKLFFPTKITFFPTKFFFNQNLTFYSKIIFSTILFLNQKFIFFEQTQCFF